MDNEAHINPAVSALVMLAAIAGTWGVYSNYQDNQVAMEYAEAQTSLEQTASALVSLRLSTPAVAEVATSTATTTEKAPELE